MSKPWFQIVALLTLVAVMAFPIAGCGSLQKFVPKPPAGYEDSFLWQHNFMPFGPAVVRGAFYAVATVAPASRNVLLTAFTTAKGALAAGNLTDGLKNLADVLAVNIDEPFVSLAAKGALDLLNSIVVLPKTVLDPGDKAIALEMLDNLIADLNVAPATMPGIKLKSPKQG